MIRGSATIAGAEYAPIPAGAWTWRGNALGIIHRERALAGSPDEPGPHVETWSGEDVLWVVDLLDADTALLVLRRVLATRTAPPMASALSQVALTGRWGAHQAEQLGAICRRVWEVRRAA